MDKAFITDIKQTLLSEPKPIGTLIERAKGLKTEYFKLSDKFNIIGYVESIEKEEDDDKIKITHKNILFITIIPKSMEECPRYYTNTINKSKLLTRKFIANKDKVYFLVYQSSKDYRIFNLVKETNSKTNEFTYKANYIIGGELSALTRYFSNTELINTDSIARNELTAIIDDIWSCLGYGSDKRWQFIILIYILLKNDEIPYTTGKGGKTLSLRQYEELKDKVHNFDNMAEGNLDEINKFYNEFHVNGSTLIQAFRNIIQYKEYKHDDDYNKRYKDINEKHLKKLNQLIESFNNEKLKNNAAMIIDNIYQRIFKQVGKNIDICKITFEVEQKYNNRFIQTTVASKGQIYTHSMMKNLIVEIFSKNIKDGDTCYDPTCGTGGFAESFYEFCDEHKLKNTLIYCNEIDEDCSNMAWIHGLCSNQDVRAFNYDCFSSKLKGDLIPLKSINYVWMNPPYGMKGNYHSFPSGFTWDENEYLDTKKLKPNELTFCRYNMESYCKYGGWFAWVIPTSSVSENKQNISDKEYILQEAEIWYVIKIREDIFTPQAGKACCIVIGKYIGRGKRTKKEYETWKTKCIDFADDGGEIKKKKGEIEYNYDNLRTLWYDRILDGKELEGLSSKFNEVINNITNSHNGEEYYEERNLKANDNWIYTKREQLDETQFRLLFHSSIEQRRHERMTSLLHSIDWSKLTKPENINCEWRDTKITDLFDILGKSSKNKYNVNECSPIPTNDKRIKYYSMIDHDNGLKGYVEKPSIEGDDYYIIIGNYGSSNDKYCSYCIQAPFNYDSVHTIIIKPKDAKQFTEDDLTKIAFLIGMKFVKSYTYGNALNSNRLANESVRLPYNKLTNAIDLKITTTFDVEGLEVCRDVNINEIFELVKITKYYDKANVADGSIPLIGASEHNNGIIGFVNEYSYDAIEPVITVSGFGTSGICFVQRGKVAIRGHGSVIVIKLKPQYSYLNECLNALAFAMTLEFKHKYNWRYGMTSTRLMNETIHQIPFCQDVKDNSKMIIDVSGLRYIYI